jgi:predicted phage baseplate assembly protein
VILVDHGAPVTDPADQALEGVSEGGRYRPKLKRSPLTQQGRVLDPLTKELVLFDPKASAAAAFRWDQRDVRPCITLQINGREWQPVRDLLNSDRFAAEFVVETEDDGSATLRFGDDVLGLRPLPDLSPIAVYRIGNGASGNVGAGSITRLVLVSNPTQAGAIAKVWNPMPAAGGSEPEALEQVRQFAPQAFRVQERAVTPADWSEVAQRQTGVQKAAARLRWTGSWYTAFVTIDRQGGAAVDSGFKDQMGTALDRYRLAGYDLEINGPRSVPLEIQLQVCVKPGYFRSNVRLALLKAFQTFFDPDNFTFGQPLYLSQVYQAAMSVDGVQSVQVIRFKRWGKAEAGEKEAGLITPGQFEVLRLDNDPNFPENGKIDFEMEAGL